MSIQSEENSLFKTGQVSFDGVLLEVSLAVVPEAHVGDYVLVHVGMALSVIDEKEAKKTLDYLKKMDELRNELDMESFTDE